MPNISFLFSNLSPIYTQRETSFTVSKHHVHVHSNTQVPLFPNLSFLVALGTNLQVSPSKSKNNHHHNLNLFHLDKQLQLSILSHDINILVSHEHDVSLTSSKGKCIRLTSFLSWSRKLWTRGACHISKRLLGVLQILLDLKELLEEKEMINLFYASAFNSKVHIKLGVSWMHFPSKGKKADMHPCTHKQASSLFSNFIVLLMLLLSNISFSWKF